MVLGRHSVRELYQAEYSHDGPVSRGRLGRIYWNSHAAYQMGRVLTCFTLPWKDELSQHCTIVFERGETSGHRFPLKPLDMALLEHPSWATRTALAFKGTVVEATQERRAPPQRRRRR